MKRPCILLLTISLVGVAPPGIPLSTRAGATDEPVRAGSLLSASTPAEPLLQDVLGAPLRASSRATKENEGAFDVAFSASQWRPTTYDNDTFQLDGYNWYVSAEKSHSFAYDPSSGVYRFEVRDGDVFSSARHTDPSTSERSEISMSQRQALSGAGSHFAATWDFMIEPGPQNSAQWLSLGQVHNGLRSPSVEFGMRGDDTLDVVIRGDFGEREIEFGKVQRGHWYDIKMDVDVDPRGNGHVYVWLDGKQVVNYTGVVGYSDQKTSHWNMGIYRKSPVNNETLVYNVKDFDMTWGQAGHSTSAPSQDHAPTPAPSPRSRRPAPPTARPSSEIAARTLLGEPPACGAADAGGADAIECQGALAGRSGSANRRRPMPGDVSRRESNGLLECGRTVGPRTCEA